MTPASLQPASLVPASILIVEDESVVALDLRGELEALGYRVVGIADSAHQAIELVHRHRPQIALMDIMLRGNDDGIAIAGRLRREYGTPVVFLTSFSDSETVARAAREAAYGYLTKPFQIKELRAGIEVALWKSQMERQLHESDRWFAQTLRCVQDGVIVVAADGITRFMNPAAERLLGQRTEEAAGRRVVDVVRFAEDDTDAAPPGAGSALREGRIEPVRHARMLRSATGLVPVDQSAGPISDEHGQFMGSVIVLRDASERLLQEALLRGSEERFRQAFEFAPLGMALVAFDGKFMQANDAMGRLLGRTPQRLAALTQASVTHADDTAHEAGRLAELLRTRQALTQFEKRYLREGDAEPVWVLVNASIISAQDQPACFLYQVHDLTAQRAAAAQLAELADARVEREAGEVAERTRGEFLSRISHEMRTPLNAVLGFSQLLQVQHAAGKPPSTAYADHILAAGKHLLALVDDVLDLQRASDGTLSLNASDVGLDEFLPATIALLEPIAGERGVQLQRPIATGLSMRADATRLRQVVLNIGSNAVKYNVDGGTVSFAVTSGQPGRVRISVHDTGIGMSDEQLGHLYEPFNRLGRETLAVSGVGLGLVITRKLVERMQGTMAVHSKAGHGTTVTIDLPGAG